VVRDLPDDEFKVILDDFHQASVRTYMFMSNTYIAATPSDINLTLSRTFPSTDKPT
jgi:hypothetical protein